MTHSEEFFCLVAEMRHFQKLYFKAKKTSPEKANRYFQKSLDLEKKVDDVIEKVKKSTNPRAGSVQFLIETFPVD